ncbi:MAG: heparinase II/III family protein [Gemmatimonadaceae bacterium]|nr:heparinase II/III family protein [Chitinophagaceae bacterium]
MNVQKIAFTAICSLLLASLSFAQTDFIGAEFQMPAHPRLLMLKGQEDPVKKNVAADKNWQRIQQAIFAESDNIAVLPSLERKQVGRRLLGVSREALRRIFFLSYSYRMTGKDAYLQAAQREMKAVSGFSDWNPSHFLDVAEMTMAVAIGYDWLYDKLSAEDRTTIKSAIMQKGLLPSMEAKNNSWTRAEHNWNQVCNAGMAYGAIAIFEDDPALAKEIINRAIGTIVVAMKDYGPDGAYPEGYGYWGYGTSFNVMFNDAIEKLFGKDFGLNSQPGFLKTAAFLENMTGPSGKPFNYSDAGTNGGLQTAMFWFANKVKDPSLLWVERSRLLTRDPASHMKDRLLPAMMLWAGNTNITSIQPPKQTMYVGRGKNPVALMRTSWTDSNAIYVAMKGGSVSVNHAHMDIGSFVMEAQGQRWAMDFGMQEYESLESKGIQLFGRTQNAQRWTVFRYTNLVHNTLTVNNKHQRVEGSAPITTTSDAPNKMHGVTDISEVYKGALTKAVRGISIIDKSYVQIRDEIETADTISTVRWTMLTPASVKITGTNRAELTQNGKTLILEVKSPAEIMMKTWSTDPPNSYDAPNPGTIMVGFETIVKPNSKAVLEVVLTPRK